MVKILHVARFAEVVSFETDDHEADFSLSDGQLDALKEWLTRPKPWTPAERAADVLIQQGLDPKAGKLAKAIAAAIEDAARRGVDWEEG